MFVVAEQQDHKGAGKVLEAVRVGVEGKGDKGERADLGLQQVGKKGTEQGD